VLKDTVITVDPLGAVRNDVVNVGVETLVEVLRVEEIVLLFRDVEDDIRACCAATALLIWSRIR
jgi:hypothetical protein